MKIYSLVVALVLLSLIAGGCCCSLCSKINIPTSPTPVNTGYTGPTGSTGTIEETGSTGTTEETGSTGTTEEIGSTGTTEEIGSTGTTEDTGTTTNASNLKIDSFSFLEKEEGPVTTTTNFKTGQTMWFQFRISGFTREPGGRSWVTEDLVVEDGNGNLIQRFDKLYELNEQTKEGDDLKLTNHLDVPANFTTGNFVLRIVATDKLNDEVVEEKYDFTLE